MSFIVKQCVSTQGLRHTQLCAYLIDMGVSKTLLSLGQQPNHSLSLLQQIKPSLQLKGALVTKASHVLV